VFFIVTETEYIWPATIPDGTLWLMNWALFAAKTMEVRGVVSIYKKNSL
jgi:hypothetical protein